MTLEVKYSGVVVTFYVVVVSWMGVCRCQLMNRNLASDILVPIPLVANSIVVVTNLVVTIPIVVVTNDLMNWLVAVVVLWECCRSFLLHWSVRSLCLWLIQVVMVEL